MLKEGKYYTSLSLLSNDNGVQVAISAFDGTLSFKKLMLNKSNKYEFLG